MKFTSHCGIAVAIALMAAGCGGGTTGNLTGLNSSGGGALAPGNPSKTSPSLNALATSSKDSRFSHAYVKVYSVDLTGPKGTTRVFSNSNGQVLDVANLQNSKGPMFAFLHKAGVPAQTFTSVKVRLARTTTMISTGQTKGVQRQFIKDLNDPRNTTVTAITTTLKNPLVVSSPNQKLVVDMNIKSWAIDSKGTIRPSMQQGSEAGSDDPGQQESEDFGGVISGLTGTDPAFSFTLGNLTVATDVNTKIFNSDGSPNPALANDENVEVKGVVVNGVLTASEIKIEVGDGHGDNNEGAKAQGIASSLDATAGTLTLTIQEAEGFVPGGTTVPVVTSATTQYVLSGASATEADFFAALAVAPVDTQIEVEGSFDGTNLNATFIKAEIENSGVGGGDQPSPKHHR